MNAPLALAYPRGFDIAALLAWAALA